MVIYFCWDFAASFMHLNAELFRYADGTHACCCCWWGVKHRRSALVLCCFHQRCNFFSITNWFGAPITFLAIINVVNSCAAKYVCGNIIHFFRVLDQIKVKKNSISFEFSNWKRFTFDQFNAFCLKKKKYIYIYMLYTHTHTHTHTHTYMDYRFILGLQHIFSSRYDFYFAPLAFTKHSGKEGPFVPLPTDILCLHRTIVSLIHVDPPAHGFLSNWRGRGWG